MNASTLPAATTAGGDFSLGSVLAAAQDLYRRAPAHGMPSYDPATGDRTHCVISAIYTVACAMRASAHVAPALSLVGYGRPATAVAKWEARSTTEEIVAAFTEAMGSMAWTA